MTASALVELTWIGEFWTMTWPLPPALRAPRPSGSRQMMASLIVDRRSRASARAPYLRLSFDQILLNVRDRDVVMITSAWPDWPTKRPVTGGKKTSTVHPSTLFSYPIALAVARADRSALWFSGLSFP